MSVGTFGPAVSDRITVAKSSVAKVNNLGGGKVITMRTANHVGDNQKLQTIADAVGRGDVTDTQVNA